MPDLNLARGIRIRPSPFGFDSQEDKGLIMVEHVLRCRCAFGIIKTPHELSFRVYPDGCMAVDIGAVAVAQEDDEQGIRYLGMDGRATRLDDADAPRYSVEFTVLRWDRPALGYYFLRMRCSATLSPLDGLTGSYSAGDIDAPFKTFRTTEAFQEPMTQQLYPLTPGKYELSALEIGANGPLRERFLSLSLAPDGSLRCTARESLPGAKECALQGTWTRDQICYSLQSLINFFGAGPSTYAFTCKPTLADMRGVWENADGAVREFPSEHGAVEFRLLSSARQWSEHVHGDYPEPFRRATRSLLLASLRVPALNAMPCSLWSLVLSYCAFEWFGCDARSRRSSSDVVC